MISPRCFMVYCLTWLLSWQPQVTTAGPNGPGRYRGLGQPPEGLLPDAAREYRNVLSSLNTTAAKLEKSHGDRLPESRPSLQQIQSDADFLQRKWIDWSQRHPGRSSYSGTNVRLEPYFRALQAMQKQLKESPKSNDEEILGTVKAVAADLHAKAENCRHSADGLGKDIKVTVRTKKGTEEAPGYEVWCAPMALVKFKNEHIRFPKISSPTVFKNFAPGHYVMWLEKGKEKLPPVTQTIGGHGETEFEIDLPVSAESEGPK
ncbi:MAG: hypothetical protein HY298_15395 [Verrucomicrobia bacterium]|nr:hypothetical protein [Verrucomicrobiota bacterium]